MAATSALGLDRLDVLDLRHQEVFFLHQLGQLRAALPLDQHAHRAIGQFEQLQHRGHHAHVEQIVAMRIVTARIELGQQEDVLVARHGRFESSDGFFAPHEQRHHHAGEHHDIAQGQKRKQGHSHIHPLQPITIQDGNRGFELGYGVGLSVAQWVAGA
jgi:hypothetical protein